MNHDPRPLLRDDDHLFRVKVEALSFARWYEPPDVDKLIENARKIEQYMLERSSP